MGNRTSLGNEQYAVNKYIGTAYDHVKNVSENMDDVKTIADALGDEFPDGGIGEVADNIDKVITVADSIVDVNMVADNVLEVVEVADNIDAVLDAPNQAQIATEQAVIATEAADSIGRYQGLWPDTGGSADKGDTYQTQVSGTPTGQYFTALENTAVDPIGDNVTWRVVISNRSLGGVTNYQAASVADMVDGVTLDNVQVWHAVGQVWRVKGSELEVISTPVLSLDNFKPLTPITISALGIQPGGSLNSAFELIVSHRLSDIIIDVDCISSGGIYNIDFDLRVKQTAKITHAGNAHFTLKNPTKNEILKDGSVGDLVRGGGYKTFADASNVETGDYIIITTPDDAETTYNYNKAWMTTVSFVEENTVFFDTQSRFDFSTGTNPTYYHTKAIDIEWDGLDLNTELVSTLGFGWRFFEFSLNFENVKIKSSDTAYAINMIRCAHPSGKHIKLIKGVYPFMFTGGCSGYFEDIYCSGVRHAIATSEFPDTLRIKGIRGSCGVIESHPAFDVHYEDVDLVTGSPASGAVANLRSVGGSIRNAKLRHTKRPGVTPNDVYVQLVQLVDSSLWDSAVFTMENVDWYRVENVNAQEALPLDIYYGGEVHLKNVHAGERVTVGLSTAGKDIMGSVFLDNVTSDVKAVQARGEKVKNGDDVYDAVDIGSDNYELRMSAVGQGSLKASIHGQIYRGNSVGQTKDVNLRIYPKIEFNNVKQNITFWLTLKAGCRHSNAGVFSTVERKYNGHLKNTPAYALTLPTTPTYISEPSGQSNESLTLSGFSGVFVEDVAGNYIEVSFTADIGGRTNPIISFVDYELEMFYS